MTRARSGLRWADRSEARNRGGRCRPRYGEDMGMAEIVTGGRPHGDRQRQGRPNWLGRIAIVTAGAVALALVVPPVSQASPVRRSAAANPSVRRAPAPRIKKPAAVGPEVPTSSVLEPAPPSIPGPTTH